MMDRLGTVMHGLALAGVSVFVVLATLNAFILVRNLIKHDRPVSMIPLIGGLSGFLGCLAMPSLRYYAVAPLILDVGTGFPLVGGLPLMLAEMWQTCRCNLLREYVGFANRKKVHLRLFRHGIVVLRQDFERKPGELGIVACSTIGNWSQANGELRLKINDEEAVYRIGDKDGQALHQATGFHTYEKDKDLALAEIEFQLQYSAPKNRSSDC
jgi:hypothetical protein